MRKMKYKRPLALILCAALLLTQLGVAAYAQETPADDADTLCEQHPERIAEFCEICNTKDSGTQKSVGENGTPAKADTEKTILVTAFDGLSRAVPYQSVPAGASGVYDSGDIAVINAIIENNGLSATKDSPEDWAGIVTWNDESPKRITQLIVYEKELSGTLDVSGLTALTVLSCLKNRLTGLNVSGLVGLEQLYCYENQLTELELSGLAQLSILGCGDNRLTKLDLTDQAGLTRFSCSGNPLTGLDVSNLTELEWLECERNGLTTLDLSGLDKLKILHCQDNPLASFKLANDEELTVGSVAGGTVMLTDCDHDEKSITLKATPQTNYSFKQWSATGTVLTDAAANPVTFTLDANISIAPVYTYTGDGGDAYDSGDVAVVNAIIDRNGLNAAKDSPEDWGTAGIVTWNDESPKRITGVSVPQSRLSGRLDVSGLTGLTELNCSMNSLTGLNASGLTSLTKLFCGHNPLKEMDLSNLTSLTFLDFSFSELKKLDVTGLTSLTTLNCYFNFQLTELDVSGLTNLTTLHCAQNALTKLDVSGLTGLTELACYRNQLEELDLSGLTSLDKLNCGNNPLTELDLSGVPGLTDLACNDSQLTELDLSGVPGLTKLECRGNQLKALDLSGLTGLTKMYCGNNQLTKLDVSRLTNLIELSCSVGQIEELDVSGLKKLRSLYCYDNQLTELDVSSLSSLYRLYCYSNQLTELDLSGVPGLTDLNCSSNQLRNLDISGLTKLEEFYCDDNPLTSLKVTNDKMLAVGRAAGGTVMLTNYDYETQSATLKAIPSANYSFKNWTTSGTVLANDTENPVEFLLDANISMTPVYTDSRGSGSGGGDSSDDGSGSTPTITTPASTDKDPAPAAVAQTSVEAKTDQNGNASVTVAEKNVTGAIKAAQDAAKKAGTEKNGIIVVVDVKTGTTATSLSTTLPLNAVDALIKANVTNVCIRSATASVTLDLTALKTAQATAKGAITVSVAKQNVSGLSAAAQKAIGNRPTFRFTLQSGGKPVTDFGNGTASISVPYAPQAGEDTGKLCMVYVDDLGGVTFLTNSSYDPNTKSMLGRTGHFSVYGVGYKADAPVFTDTTNHWARIDIDFVAARGLLPGTGNTQFSPDAGMTRKTFVTALGRLAGIDPAQYKNTKFTDVAATAHYAPYVAWAAEKGIVDGVTATTFAPETSINREQMAVIMANYAKATGYTIPKNREAVTFADHGSIASGAKKAVQAMQMAGVMAGKDSNKFDPKGTLTRAESAAVLHRYVELVIDPATAQGWTQNDSGSKMYFKNGKALTGWLQLGGKWYYFNSTGVMAANTVIDGYTIGSDGARMG